LDLNKCLEHFKKVIEIDPSFLKTQLRLRISEVCYKQGNLDEAFKTMAEIEGDLRMQDKHMLHLLKGKCYDKARQYK
jgi:hypothetical protein